MSEEFQKAAAEVVNLAVRPTDAELLEVYSLYKQVTVGNCNSERACCVDSTGTRKHDAWTGKAGTSKEDAEEQYIEIVEELKKKYGMN
eukprot:Seg1328.6 transcript_id=Seg1328.6/GoldUCD/mRNA.D3Y31 product="hypothetical protein" protein_id=Seg1328.6/GoldUCD/D3Y31